MSSVLEKHQNRAGRTSSIINAITTLVLFRYCYIKKVRRHQYLQTAIYR